VMIIAAVASALLHLPMPSVLEMHAQLNAIEASKAPPVFRHLLAWDVYDGIETGLAVSTDHLYCRIRSVGDARSGLRRAFILTHLPDFNPALQLLLPDTPNGWRFDFLDEEAWEEIRVAAAGEDFVAISNCYLDRFVCGPRTAATPETFVEAHKHLRYKFRAWRH